MKSVALSRQALGYLVPKKTGKPFQKFSGILQQFAGTRVRIMCLLTSTKAHSSHESVKN
jgi:hypothetical protein